MEKNCAKCTIKRLCLIFLVGPILIFIPQLRFSQSIYYITPIIILFTISVLLNFPSIIHLLHGKIATIEDLKDIHSADKNIKNRFITIFEWSLTFMLAILIATMVDYYLNTLEVTDLTVLEIIGVFGGFISLLYRCEGIIGKILLFLLKRYKQELTPAYFTNKQNIELTEIPGSPSSLNFHSSNEIDVI